MSAIVVSGGHVLGSGGAVFATGSGGGGGTQINYAIATSTTTATVYLTVVGTYSLYRNGTLIASSQSSSTYNDTGLSANTTYTYSLTSGGGGFTVTMPVFFFTDFSAAPSTISLPGDGSGYVNNGIGVPAVAMSHAGGAGWYKTQQNISTGFTTNFTFAIPVMTSIPTGTGIAFVVQNGGNNGNPEGFYGVNYVGDANLQGYGWYDLSGQYQPTNSIAIVLILSAQNGTVQDYKTGGTPATIGLYLNGGSKGVFIPEQDIRPFGLSFYAGDLMAATVVYDGSTITMVFQDTVTSGQARFTWPLNIPSAIGGDMAWVGFTGANSPSSAQINTINSWNYTAAVATRLATPTLSPAGGSYGSSQTVTISYPAGSTCYYTTNGLAPTSASTQYTGPITVSANEYVQAIAIQTGYTDSFVGAANYLISSADTINFGSGFSSASNLIIPTGNAQFSGSVIELVTSGASFGNGAAGNAWYVAPVPIGTFSTVFTLQFSSNQTGATFIIQNQNPTSSDSTALMVSGGPLGIGGYGTGMGYSFPPGTGTDANGFQNSVAVTFNNIGGANSTGVYTNGELPTGSDTTISGVSFNSGHPIQVTLAYNGTALTVAFEDTTTSATAGPYTLSSSINIASIVGGSTAYVGFGAGTNYVYANLSLNSWTF